MGGLLLCALALAGSGCGPEDEVIQRQPGPTVDVKNIDPKDIKPIPQAPKFTGTPREVAIALDRTVEAFNTADAKYLCTKGYTKDDLAALNKQGGCIKVWKKFFDVFDGYRMTITEIRVKGNVATVKAQALTTDLRNPKKALVQPLNVKLVKEDGEWRMSIDAERTLEQQQKAQASAATGATK